MLIQVLLIFGFCFAIWITWKRYGQNAISLKEAILWSILWLGGVSVTLIPKITERLALLFGVGRGVDLILYLAVAIQFFLIFKLFVNNEKLERILTKIVQDGALTGSSQSPKNNTSLTDLDKK
ncbi:DUF2304 domain-containing protein [Patescibacteria group bacterium]|nr:DUF2304 domain-containing protein [Patescibacteria group bacterium]